MAAGAKSNRPARVWGQELEVGRGNYCLLLVSVQTMVNLIYVECQQRQEQDLSCRELLPPHYYKVPRGAESRGSEGSIPVTVTIDL